MEKRQETSAEKRERQQRTRLLRVARRMETLKKIDEDLKAESDGDPFSLELKARLTRMDGGSGHWGNRSKTKRRKKFSNGFKSPRPWKSGQQKGLSILDKALTFMSTFKDEGLGFRNLHILIMLTGKAPLTIQEAADISGLTYYAIRHPIKDMEKNGFIKTIKTKRRGGMHPSCSIELTAKGAAVMRALNRFDPDKITDYDRAISMAIPVIPTDLRLLSMQSIINHANQTDNDL